MKLQLLSISAMLQQRESDVYWSYGISTNAILQSKKALAKSVTIHRYSAASFSLEKYYAYAWPNWIVTNHKPIFYDIEHLARMS